MGQTQLTKILLKELLQEQIKHVIAIYPGRFQPMGKHHYATYKWAKSKFKDVYVATSDKVDLPNSPFNFAEKSKIISKYGVPTNKIVAVKNPYVALEIVSKFNSYDTAVVFIVGQKDADRLKQGKFFLPYNGSPEFGYKEHAYYIVAPHASFKVPGYGEMSGTEIRKALSNKSLPNDKKIELFKQIFGFYDKGIYDIIIHKLNQISEVRSLIKHKLITEAKQLIKQIINEGGAAGHMQHLHDDLDLTFGDFKNIIEQALQGKLSVKEGGISEKTDGQNIQVTMKDGKIGLARNKGTIISPMSIEQTSTKFAGRGDIHDAFVYSMTDLEKALNALGKDVVANIFKNGKVFINAEILFPATKNVIDYDVQVIQFHGLVEYDDNGNKIGEDSKFASKLQSMIAKVNADTQSHFKIIPPAILTQTKSINFAERKQYFLSKLNQIQSKYKLSDKDNVAMFNQKWWEDEINSALLKFNTELSTDQYKKLLNRWVYNDKSIKLKDINTNSPEFNKWLDNVDKNDKVAIYKKNIAPLDNLFLELGIEVLKNANGFLAANPTKAVQSMRNDIAKTISAIKLNGDVSQINKLITQLNRIKSIGGFDAIVPAEGVVFKYNGKTYKFTGIFAPINQLLGILRY